MASGSKHLLFRSSGCGSISVEVLLKMLQVEYDVVDINYKELKGNVENESIKRLAQHNPLKQIPTFITKEGAVLTESAAILLHLTEAHRRETEKLGLRPFIDQDPKRAAEFTRWMFFAATNIYAVMVMNDTPKRWVADDSSEEAVDAFQTKVDDRMYFALRILNDGVQGPYILGDRLTILDVYVAMICCWIRNGSKERFSEELPKLLDVIAKVEENPIVREVWLENEFVPIKN
ncbi:uncharacterized protein EV422DRAFT_504480 [Fimicolochytrium jonesii]|uniref:uncharacterized protein n=1 Tax=Fimicolochytrium jonesii TaxID=1396493 RepID=UPI0022FEB10A|nr:uncharacterized protein EV422DRAFT_504480 [Fimicolochytrium jonesii]KAI8824496.1 hypothetical protein EV422DRAFT_504480 [Fimicolochytrium jonesii]